MDTYCTLLYNICMDTSQLMYGHTISSLTVSCMDTLPLTLYGHISALVWAHHFLPNSILYGYPPTQFVWTLLTLYRHIPHPSIQYLYGHISALVCPHHFLPNSILYGYPPTQFVWTLLTLYRHIPNPSIQYVYGHISALVWPHHFLPNSILYGYPPTQFVWTLLTLYRHIPHPSIQYLYGHISALVWPHHFVPNSILYGYPPTQFAWTPLSHCMDTYPTLPYNIYIDTSLLLYGHTISYLTVSCMDTTHSCMPSSYGHIPKVYIPSHSISMDTPLTTYRHIPTFLYTIFLWTHHLTVQTSQHYILYGHTNFLHVLLNIIPYGHQQFFWRLYERV